MKKIVVLERLATQESILLITVKKTSTHRNTRLLLSAESTRTSSRIITSLITGLIFESKTILNSYHGMMYTQL